MQWRTNPGQELPTLVYKTTERTLEVTLKCLGPKESNRLDVQGLDKGKGVYTMTLSSKCACWDGCKGSSLVEYSSQAQYSTFSRRFWFDTERWNQWRFNLHHRIVRVAMYLFDWFYGV